MKNSSYLSAYKDGTGSVPKRRHIKFRRWGVTQKKAQNIRNTAKVWNQIRFYFTGARRKFRFGHKASTDI